ncbi:hypothetical protein MAQ5080_03381 [Marinomonas aquimarina]|uniref:DUF3570 domain-containing protein n=1 Tax=Marinomonas aquimarina TaxID=295068 RepID=A0A1A8TSA3_9GAMM|nr:hypothetical protein [Marinomonas aquimarina]SBS36182.1 hypothetical protein MAQ5080_03381 [Marinomonas aquimarina]
MTRLIKSVSKLGSLLCTAMLWGPLAQADTVVAPSDQPEPGWWQSTHQNMSNTVGEWSNNLDTFFSGKRHDSVSESVVSMTFGSIVESEDGVSGFFNLDARLHLPNTENRLDLIIESDADELTQDNRLFDNEPGQSLLQSAQNTRFATMLRYFKEEWNANIDMGLLVEMPVDPFVRITFKQDMALGKWGIRQEESIFSYYTLGYGARYGIEALRQLSPNYQFGADFGVTYLEVEADTFWRENLFLNQRLSDKSKLRYQFSYLQEGSTPRAESFLYFVEYQRLLHDNWLIGQLKPQMTYERENDYQSEFSLTASLEVLLGPGFL